MFETLSNSRQLQLMELQCEQECALKLETLIEDRGPLMVTVRWICQYLESAR